MSETAVLPHLTCTLKVTYPPGNGLQQYMATLQVLAAGSPRGAEVALPSSLI